MDGELVGLLRVAFEEPGLGLADIHHAEERRVRQQLDVFVRARRGRGHVPVPDAIAADAGGAIVTREQGHELAERLAAAEAAQATGFVQTGHTEPSRVELAIADGLVIGQVDGVGVVYLVETSDEPDGDAEHRGVSVELLAHTQRDGDERVASGQVAGDARHFKLHYRLAQAEGRETGRAALAHQPGGDGSLVRFEQGMEGRWLHLEAFRLGEADLGSQEVFIGGHAVSLGNGTHWTPPCLTGRPTRHG